MPRLASAPAPTGQPAATGSCHAGKRNLKVVSVRVTKHLLSLADWRRCKTQRPRHSVRGYRPSPRRHQACSWTTKKRAQREFPATVTALRVTVAVAPARVLSLVIVALAYMNWTVLH